LIPRPSCPRAIRRPRRGYLLPASDRYRPGETRWRALRPRSLPHPRRDHLGRYCGPADPADVGCASGVFDRPTPRGGPHVPLDSKPNFPTSLGARREKTRDPHQPSHLWLPTPPQSQTRPVAKRPRPLRLGNATPAPFRDRELGGGCIKTGN